MDQTRAHFHLNYLSHLHPSWVSFHETLGNSQGLPPFLRSSLAFRISSVGRCCHLDFTFTGKGLECQEFERVSDSLLQIWGRSVQHFRSWNATSIFSNQFTRSLSLKWYFVFDLNSLLTFSKTNKSGKWANFYEKWVINFTTVFFFIFKHLKQAFLF